MMPLSPAQMADRHQHHVAGGEPGDGKAAQQHAPFLVPGRVQRGHVEWHQPVAERLDHRDQAVRVRRHAAPRQVQAAGGHVDPARQDVRLLRQHRLDQPDAGAALQAVNGQGHFEPAIRAGRDVAGEVPALRRFRPQRAGADVEQPLLVVAAQPEALDDPVRRLAPRAAEPLSGRGREAAMGAGGFGGDGGGKRQVEGGALQPVMARLVRATHSGTFWHRWPGDPPDAAGGGP